MNQASCAENDIKRLFSATFSPADSQRSLQRTTPQKKVTVAKTYYVVTTFVTSFESLFGYLKKTLFFCQRSQSLKVLSNCTFRSSFLGRHYVCMMKLMSRNSLSQKPLDHHKGVTFSDDDSKKIPKEHTPKGTYPKYP